jgi:hypothetical protein
MNRDTKGRFIKTNNDAMKLAIGDKITSYSQFREGMIVSFDAKVHNGISSKWIHITNAIMVKDKENNWFACHDNREVIGNLPFFAIFDKREYSDKAQKIMMFNKQYSWQICLENKTWRDSKDTVFCGFSDPKSNDEYYGNLLDPIKPKYQKGDIVLIRESLINHSLCCCKVTDCYNSDSVYHYTLHILTTPTPIILYNFKEENIVNKIGITVEE